MPARHFTISVRKLYCASGLLAAAAFITVLLWPQPLHIPSSARSPNPIVAGTASTPVPTAEAASSEPDKLTPGGQPQTLASDLRALPHKPDFLTLLEFQLRLSRLDLNDLESIFTAFPSCTDHLDKDSRAALASAFFARLAEFDSEAAFRRAIQLSIQPARTEAETVDDPTNASLRTTPPHPVDLTFLNAACQGSLLVWSQRDWKSAVDAAFQAVAEESLSDSAVYAVLAQLVLRHPVELIDYVGSTYADDPHVWRDSILRNWGSNDPKAALDWVNTNLSSTEQSNIFPTLLGSFGVTVDPQRFPELVEEIVNIQDFHQREDALVSITRILARRDIAAAFEILRQIPKDQLTESFLSENAFWMARDPVAAAPFIEGLTPSPTRTRLIRRHAAAMAWTDPAQARDWIHSVAGLTSKERETLVLEVMPANEGTDPTR